MSPGSPASLHVGLLLFGALTIQCRDYPAARLDIKVTTQSAPGGNGLWGARAWLSRACAKQRLVMVSGPPARHWPLGALPFAAFARPRRVGAIRSAAFELPPVRSKPTHEKQYDEDDQDDADDTDAAVTEAVAVAAEAATEATKQEDDEDDDEYESERHDLSPVAAPSRALSLFALRL